MTTDDDPFWRKCELAWAAFLSANDHVVTLLADANGEGAPLMLRGHQAYRAPDIQSMKGGLTYFWEVKQRHSASINLLTGEAEYWVSASSLVDYIELGRITGIPVQIVLHDGEVWRAQHKWFQADAETLYAHGQRGTRRASDGSEIEAWIWPARAMRLVPGPDVERVVGSFETVLVRGGGEKPVADSLLSIAEKHLRGRGSDDDAVTVADEQRVVPPGVFDLLREDAKAALATLSRTLGIPETPCYSVMRIGIDGVELDDLLGLMDYGIRLFLVVDEKPEWIDDPTREEWLAACVESRLLEWTVIPGASARATWVVDGEVDDDLRDFLSDARPHDPFNLGQYVVVHASHLEHVLVTAGAGTGKTETMSERIVFLLATAQRHPDPRDEERIYRLHLDEIVLVTFTREAKREMRERIARTLMLRQRLCSRCVLPTIAWMLELSNTEIETIHTYSKKLVAREGARMGIGPGFKVGNRTMEFARALAEALSPHLEALYTETAADGQELPPSHEVQKFAMRLWDKLAGNGFSPLGSALSPGRSNVSWGETREGVEGDVARAFEEAIATAAASFAEECIRNQTIPISELVTTAARAIAAANGDLVRPPRYIFVDEFQDTDSEQIGMILAVRRLSGAMLFVVGDEKQGIYRFRGAEGNAFRELESRAKGEKVEIVEASLNRNFRSGSHLLDSMHPYFLKWGAKKFLRYDAGARLVAALGPRSSRTVQVTQVRKDDDEIRWHVHEVVKRWLESHPGPMETVAVLCRANWQAKSLASHLKSQGIACETRVGGDFFQTQVVSDLRVFLEAVLNPHDDAALLESCSTRWFPGIAAMQLPARLDDAAAERWGGPLPPIMTWAERLTTLGADGRFGRSDLDALRVRFEWLGSRLTKSPVLGWLMDCEGWFDPRSTVLPGDFADDDSDRVRYGRGFDHLVTLLDEEFADAPISPHGLLEWLRLKIATDDATDEPDPVGGATARVAVLTVHKAKGLEFDRVVIPYTADKFEKVAQDEIAVVADNGGARLIWKWYLGNKKEAGKWIPAEFRNVSATQGGSLWDRERLEKVREEARLLYVAMTRAREELEVVVPSNVRTPTGAPGSWAELVVHP